ncbi:type VII secretion protein EccCa [Solwaraspora sp. WMMD791]|uniref:type VII secretion protein EccCa n=1 Tax=Solwaraspora sp. WMMD791 TaxID=3016086 RepID=UPI00249AB431|nr:type VII secretion protein EccCa [Solwaraspora sp. WMMD791]WFE25441.1 type VII secretion protein EccCa [Solwaraspora sp. WMMD791]
MSTPGSPFPVRLLHRAARTGTPPLPQGRLTVAAPPTDTSANGGVALITLLLPLLSTIAMAGYMITIGHRWMVVAGIAFIVVSIVSTFGIRYQMSAHARRQRARQRIRYHQHLVGIRRDARGIAAAQRAAVAVAHPSPQRLLAIAWHRQRLWERRPTDPDFLWIRIGLGTGPLCVPVALSARADPMADTDPQLAAAAEEVVQQVGTVGRQPGLIDLGRAGVVSVIGPPTATRTVGRAILCQTAALHAPEDVAVVVCAPDTVDHWRWAAWLPHVRTAGPTGEVADLPPSVASVAVAEELSALVGLLELWLARLAAADEPLLLSRAEADPGRRLVLLIDGYDPTSTWVREPVLTELLARAGKATGVSVVCLVTRPSYQPPRADVRVSVDDGGQLTLAGRSELIVAVDDLVGDAPTPALAQCLARAMAPLRLRPPRAAELAGSLSVPELLGLSRDEVVGTGRWLPAGSEQLLRAPIGIDSDGRPVVLDLKESAQGGVGPHGLVIGATGSGKSELLRTLLVGLAMTHPPDLLSFVLVDFKGGATFANAVDLPHVAGLITNLADDMALVDRVRSALVGEQQRRQRLLRDAGNVDSVREYQVRRAAGGTAVDGSPLPALPYLLVIVDEFGELLTGRPDFIDLFVQIGRVGRSLGIHLLLASQRLDEGRLRGLESHLSYRIGLRTFSAAESRAVLGTVDAYLLPSLPGSAYLKVDESSYRRFRVSHVSGPAWPAARPAAPVQLVPVPFGPVTRDAPAPDPGPAADPGPVEGGVDGPSTLDLVTTALAQVDAVAHQVWLPPLPPAIALGSVLGPVGEVSERGLQAVSWPWPGGLRVPLGVLDQPATQQQSPMLVDFGVAGNLAVVGAPQTGKSTLLRTTMLALMLTHTPDEAQFACVDLGGGGLRALAAAPHVAGVAGRRDVELARRILLDIRRLVDDRERIFADLGVDSAARWRQLRASGGLPADVRAADVFLMLDNWPAIRAEFDLADEVVVDVAARGLGVGVHVVVTANRWFDIRSNLRDSLAGRLELRLNDPSESEISRPAARALGDVVAGRGLAPPGVPYQALLPRVDDADTVDALAEAIDEAIGKLAAGWSGPAAPEVRVLPRRLAAAQLPVDAAVAGVPVGLDEVGLAPVHLDLINDDPHLVVLGDSGAGKTQLLRTWMAAMARRYTAWEIRFVVLDYRRTLLGAVPEDYLGAYAADPTAAAEYVAQVDHKLAERMPPPGLTGQDLARRDWWQGPQLFVVVDDHDLVGGGTSPLSPLVDRLAHGHDLGFHVVLARRVTGSSRGFAVDQLLARLREQQPAALILPGDSREGVLFGGHRAGDGPPGRGRLLRRAHPDTVIQVAIEEA